MMDYHPVQGLVAVFLCMLHDEETGIHSSRYLYEGDIGGGYPYLPTSGDLKSGDFLFCTTPPREQIALGHYMTSYMKYIESKCAFIIVIACEQALLFGGYHE